jgi:hypothetical protein
MRKRRLRKDAVEAVVARVGWALFPEVTAMEQRLKVGDFDVVGRSEARLDGFFNSSACVTPSGAAGTPPTAIHFSETFRTERAAVAYAVEKVSTRVRDGTL